MDDYVDYCDGYREGYNEDHKEDLFNKREESSWHYPLRMVH